MKKYVYMLVSICGFFLFFCICGIVNAQVCQENGIGSGRVVSIGIVTDGSTPKDKALVELYKKEITSVLSPEFRVNFSSRWIVSGNDSPEGVRKALNRLFAGNKKQKTKNKKQQNKKTKNNKNKKDCPSNCGNFIISRPQEGGWTDV